MEVTMAAKRRAQELTTRMSMKGIKLNVNM